MDGWIKVHKQLQDHWIWQDPIKLRWWLDILLTVNFKDAKVNVGFELYECKRGQSIHSLKWWAERWRVSKDSARNFLKLLEKDGMILHESLSKSTRITVCNYDTYQSDLHVEQTKSKRRANDEQTISDPIEEEEEREEEKEKKEVGDTNTEKSKFDIFNEWLKKTYPAVSKLKRQMTETELQTIIEKYGRTALNDILMQMENKADLNKKYTSVYLTANNWLQRGTKK